MHFRGCGNAVAFCIFAPAVAQLVYLRQARGEAEVQTNAAPAVAQLVYLRQARGDAEAPKTGLVDVLGTTETVFGAKAPVVS